MPNFFERFIKLSIYKKDWKTKKPLNFLLQKYVENSFKKSVRFNAAALSRFVDWGKFENRMRSIQYFPYSSSDWERERDGYGHME